MEALIRAKKTSANVDVGLEALDGGILVTSDVRMLWTAKGYGWQAMATSAVASLVVRPSVTAMATLFNNTSKNMVIDRVFAHNLVAAADCVSTIWLCVHPIGMTAPDNDITVRNSTRGKSAGTNGLFDNGATVVDDGWFPWGKDSTVVTVVTPGGVLEAAIAGCIILPPTAALSVQVVSSVTTATFCPGFSWFEVPISELVME